MRKQLIFKRPVFATCLGHSSANFPECRWLWRPLLFPIMTLIKHLTGLRPLVSFIPFDQLTVTSLFTLKSVSASDVSSSRTQDFLLYFAIYLVQLDLTSAINTNSLVSVDMRETKKERIKANDSNCSSTVATEA